MLRFLLRRVALIVPTFVGVTLLSFLLIHLVPGDPIEVRTGERGISPERPALRPIDGRLVACHHAERTG